MLRLKLIRIRKVKRNLRNLLLLRIRLRRILILVWRLCCHWLRKVVRKVRQLINLRKQIKVLHLMLKVIKQVLIKAHKVRIKEKDQWKLLPRQRKNPERLNLNWFLLLSERAQEFSNKSKIRKKQMKKRKRKRQRQLWRNLKVVKRLKVMKMQHRMKSMTVKINLNRLARRLEIIKRAILI